MILGKVELLVMAILLSKNIAQCDDRARPRGAMTARCDDRVAVGWAWTGRNLILDEALVMSVMVKVPQLGSPPVQGSTRFQVLVDEVDVQYGDLLYFCEVRWPSRGAMLSHVCDLQKEVATFLRQKNLPYADQFFDPRWLARLDLLTDINTHLSALNMKLQGKDILVTDIHVHKYHCLRCR